MTTYSIRPVSTGNSSSDQESTKTSTIFSTTLRRFAIVQVKTISLYIVAHMLSWTAVAVSRWKPTLNINVKTNTAKHQKL